jgi:hypothetical protein
MSVLGQTEKNSAPAYIFHFAPSIFYRQFLAEVTRHHPRVHSIFAKRLVCCADQLNPPPEAVGQDARSSEIKTHILLRYCARCRATRRAGSRYLFPGRLHARPIYSICPRAKRLSPISATGVYNAFRAASFVDGRPLAPVRRLDLTAGPP